MIRINQMKLNIEHTSDDFEHKILKTLCIKIVVKEEAAIFTILFPFKIVLSIFLELPKILSRIMACLLPSSTSILSLTLLVVVRAVSAEEKNAENNNKISNTHSRAMSLGPITFSL